MLVSLLPGHGHGSVNGKAILRLADSTCLFCNPLDHEGHGTLLGFTPEKPPKERATV